MGLMDLLIKMEHMLNAMELPQSFTSTRTFLRPAGPAATGPPDCGHRGGTLATFEVKVLFRQNTSWQGSVAWWEGKREESFRSVLELLFLMDSAAMAGDVGSIV